MFDNKDDDGQLSALDALAKLRKKIRISLLEKKSLSKNGKHI